MAREFDFYIVPTPIGNIQDITIRAIEILKTVDLIACEDTRVTQKLLNHYDIKTKCISYHKYNEKERIEYFLDVLRDGKKIALVSDAGTPAISDPGEDLVKEAIKNEIKIVPIPGAVAFIQGLICSGFDTKRFVFEGFLPMNKGNRKEHLRSLENEERTMIFYEAPHKLKRTLKDLKEFFGGDRKVVLSREITKLFEEHLRFTLDEALEYYDDENIKGEFVVLLEGAPKKEVVIEESIEELMEKYLKEGMEEKEAMKKVAKDKGISKSQVYAVVKKK